VIVFISQYLRRFLCYDYVADDPSIEE